MVKNLPKKQKKPRWRREQDQKKTKKHKKTVGFWLFLSFLLLFLGATFKLFTLYRQRVWQGEERVNLVISCQPTAVFSYATSPSSLTMLTIPENSQIEVINGYGQYKLEAISRLEEIEKKDLLAESVERALAVPIEGYLEYDNCQVEDETQVKNLFLKALGTSFLKKGKTNLSQWDLVRLFLASRKVPASQVKTFNLKAYGVLNEVTLPDGSQVFEISPEKFSLKIKDLLFEEKARKEGLSVEVLNATGSFGLAEGAAEMLLNMGLEVVGIGNTPKKQAGCLLQGEGANKKTFTGRRLARVFDCQYVSEAPEKADFSLILGEDHWRKLNER